jgi:hypothetical protein
MPSCARSCKRIDGRDAKDPRRRRREPCRRALRQRAAGHEVRRKGANSGAAAVDILRKERFDMGFASILLKPVTSDELRSTVEKVLGELAQEAR